MEPSLDIRPEIREALSRREAVVALESSVVAQGLPPAEALEAVRRCSVALRQAGAVPAWVAVLGGHAVVGAAAGELERLADPSRKAAKAGVRDLGPLLAGGGDAGTTVSATCALAALAGIPVFATGGIGGVHRRSAREPIDVSSDLAELARQPVCVVSAGPKAILDLPATAELLESLGVPVVGWRTDELPAFYARRSGVALEHRVEEAGQAAALLRAHWTLLRRREGVLLCVPPPEPLPEEEVEAAIAGALGEAERAGVAGKELTPFLLAAVSRATGGRSRRANLALLEENARVAGWIAAALAAPG